MPNGKVPTREEFWRLYPGEPYPYEEAERTQQLLEKYEEYFWEWAGKAYSMGDVDILKASTDITGTAQWSYFLRNVYGLRPGQPDYPEPAEPTGLPRGRPQAEKYGLTETDWRTLEMLGGNPVKVQRELETWIGTGYINQYQARDIWGELDVRLTQARTTLLATGYTEEEWPAEYAKQQAARERERAQAGKARLWRDVAEVGGITPGAQEKARDRRRRQMEVAGFAELGYGPALEEMRVGLEGPEPWRDWFEGKFPRTIARFKAKVPKGERIAKTWAEYLKESKPELREEYATRYPYGIYGRPGAMAPRIQTVRFA